MNGREKSEVYSQNFWHYTWRGEVLFEGKLWLMKAVHLNARANTKHVIKRYKSVVVIK